MTQSLILAIDQGGQSSRVAVYKSNGEQLCCFTAACATQNYFVDGYHQYFVEQNGREILDGIQGCLLKIQTLLGDEVNKIRAAGFAGQGSSLLCWDNTTGEAITPILSWQDIRGERYLNAAALTNRHVQAITGLRLSPHYGASKIHWCIEHYPAVRQALHDHRLCVGPIVSYLFWHLLQHNNLVDPGHAQRTLLWSLQKNSWDNSLLSAFNISESILPKNKYHNSYFGDLLLSNAKIPFTCSARDQGASLFSCGFPNKQACYINMGTGAFIQRVSEILQAPEGLLVSPLWLSENTLEPNLFCWEAPVNGAASAIDFIQQQTGLNIAPDNLQAALALYSPPKGCFLNAIGGLGAPYWRTDLESQFSESLSAHEKIFAWLESIIFQIVVNVELMSRLSCANKIIISGGLSKLDDMCQKLADLTHTSVHRNENTDATLQGIACMAAGMPAEWKPEIHEKVFYPSPNLPLRTRFEYWQIKMAIWLE